MCSRRLPPIGSDPMSTAEEKAALVTLLRRGARPHQTYSDLLEETGSAKELLSQEQLFTDDDLGAAQRDVEAWAHEGVELVSVLDPRYPENLKAVYDRPPLLFVAGQLKPEDARSIAVIGSRRASESGLAAAKAIAAHLVQCSFTVVSGLAAGIDTAAHTAALAQGARTVAVIGTGHRHSYPPQNAALQKRIATEHAVISQFWPDAPPTRRSFPMRNAVMSGMTLATVIVEASEASGSRVQSRLALAQGRPVFVLEPLLEQEWARELVTRPGTYTVSAPEQISATVERLTATDALVA
jgi:DNA processing protein